MKRSLLLGGLAAGLTAGWLLADPPAPHPTLASPTTTTKSAAPPKAVSGAPPSEGTCADCHGPGTDNSGPGSIVIVPPPTYTPGQTYSVPVALVSAGALRWGFEATALKSDNSMAGTFANIGGASTYTGVITQTTPLRYWIGQSTASLDGTYAGMASPVGWAFNWTAPAQGAGTVTFYVAGVAANNNGNPDNGDLTYISTATSTEGASTATRTMTWGAIKNLIR